MSVNGHGNDIERDPSRHSDANRPSEKQNWSKKPLSEMTEQDKKDLVERGKVRNTISKSGKFKIADTRRCGENNDVAVHISNNVPEKIEMRNQCWERDSKNSQLWHVEQGQEKFDLKADVRLQGNDITAKVKYGNGREVTYKNGEPTQINHPNGEKWSADPKQQGTWNVEAPNKDDPGHPKHFTIEDVKVSAKDGDITWHVDRGAGRGHDREIDGHNQYHDNKGAESAKQTHSHVEPLKHTEQTHSPVEPLKHAEQAQSHVEPLKHAEQAHPQQEPQIHSVAKVHAELLQTKPEQSQNPGPHPQEFVMKLGRPTHKEASSPAQLSEAPPIPRPIPLAPKHGEIPTPAPVARLDTPEPLAFVPTPQAQKLPEIASPKPIPQPKEVQLSDLQRQSEALLAQNLKNMQERSARAQAEAQIILPKLAAHTLSFPPLESGVATLPNNFPVPRPALLGAERDLSLPSPVPHIAPERSFAQPAPLPLDLRTATPAPQPILHRAETYAPVAPAPIAIDTQQSTPPAPVPVEMHRLQATDSAPSPVRPSTRIEGPVFQVTPSIPKLETAQEPTNAQFDSTMAGADSQRAAGADSQRAASADSQRAAGANSQRAAGADSQPASVSAQGQLRPEDLDHTRLQGQIAYKQDAASPGDNSTPAVQTNSPKVFNLNASIQGTHEPSPYDHGPQMVPDSTQRIQLEAGARDSAGNHPRLQGRASGAERLESGPLFDGNGLVQLASVEHKVPIQIHGVGANHGHFAAVLSAPALDSNGQPLPNQVSWVSGSIRNGKFYIDQARIDNGPIFSTLGVLNLTRRR